MKVPKKCWSVQDRNTLVALRANGVSYFDIAEVMGRGIKTLRVAVHYYDLQIPIQSARKLIIKAIIDES